MFPTHTSVFCFEEQISSCVLSHEEPCSGTEEHSAAGDARWRVTLFGAEPWDRAGGPGLQLVQISSTLSTTAGS